VFHGQVIRERVNRREARAMTINFDSEIIRAVFAQPNNDGSFPPEFEDFLSELSERRQVLMFAFAPKAAGTFLRTAAITAIQGQLIRVVYAQGGRDAEPYMPLFIRYYLGMMGEKTMVAHVHMQALPANRRFMEVFDLKPIIMIRPIKDMLASYWDMLDTDDLALEDGLNCRFPLNFRSLPRERKADLMVDMLAPWYASYFGSWIEYAKENPERVCIVRYDDLRAEPAVVLEKVLAHAKMPRPKEICEAAMRITWKERTQFRFNRGEAGRGGDYFSERHVERIRQLVSYYAVLDELAAELAG
jgi:hypothetical protein